MHCLSLIYAVQKYLTTPITEFLSILQLNSCWAVMRSNSKVRTYQNTQAWRDAYWKVYVFYLRCYIVSLFMARFRNTFPHKKVDISVHIEKRLGLCSRSRVFTGLKFISWSRTYRCLLIELVCQLATNLTSQVRYKICR